MGKFDFFGIYSERFFAIVTKRFLQVFPIVQKRFFDYKKIKKAELIFSQLRLIFFNYFSFFRYRFCIQTKLREEKE